MSTAALLKRLAKVEQVMNPPEAPPMPRIVVVFVNPDKTVAGRLIFGPGEPIGGRAGRTGRTR
jgi:hypothetical protein